MDSVEFVITQKAAYYLWVSLLNMVLKQKHKPFLTECPLTGVYTIKKAISEFFLQDRIMTQDLKTQIPELFQQVAQCTWTQPCACLFVTELALNNTWMVFCSYFSSKSIYKHIAGRFKWIYRKTKQISQSDMPPIQTCTSKPFMRNRMWARTPEYPA